MFEEENFPERPIEDKILTVTSNLTEPKNKSALQEEGLIFDKKEVYTITNFD